MTTSTSSPVRTMTAIATSCLLLAACGGSASDDAPAPTEVRSARALSAANANGSSTKSVDSSNGAIQYTLAGTSGSNNGRKKPPDGGTPPPPPPPPTTTGQLPDGSWAWSNPTTWGGTVPAAGANVAVPAGKVITLDVSPPALAGVRIEGTLRFARVDLALNAGFLDVTGALEIGTAAQPFAQRATITLTGGEPTTADGGLARGLLVRGGRLDVFGASPQPVWTKLNEHANAGATALTLKDPVSGWRAGDTVVVGPTDFYGVASAERLPLSLANQAQLTLGAPLAKFRWGKLQYVTNNGMSLTPDASFVPPATPAPTELDERAAVANLSRNIVIQGADDAAWRDRGFGAHVMVTGLASKINVDGVEIRRAGQSGRVDRYPFHWNRLSYNDQGQLLGDASGHVLRNSSIWGSSQRCVVLQATNGVQVINNVCQDIKGHAFATLEGAERRNLFEGNLALLMRSPASTKMLQLHEGPDLYQAGPSGFFLTNPDNVVRGNHSGDSIGPGFWLSFGSKPVGKSATIPIIPDRIPFGVFQFNTAHSSFTGGVTLGWAVVDALGNLGGRQYTPVLGGTEAGERQRFLLKRIAIYKNMNGALANGVSLPDYEEFTTADNVGTYFQGKVDAGNITRGLAVGYSLNNLSPWPRTWPGTPPVAFATYHSMANMHRNTVVSFPVVDKQPSGAFNTIDYYITAVDKGTVRNPANRLIQAHAGYRVPPFSLDPATVATAQTTLASAIWDPHGYWGAANQFWVLDTPFMTTGANCQWVAPAGSNGKSCDGQYFAVNAFQTDFDSNPYNFQAPLSIERQQPGSGVKLGSVEVGTGTRPDGFRHFAARASGQFVVRFPGRTMPKWVQMNIGNAFRDTDNLVLGVAFDPALAPSAYVVLSMYRGHAASEFLPGQPLAKYGRQYTLAASLAEVHASPGDKMWQDKANGLVWFKYRGGLPYPYAPVPNSDDEIYRDHTVIIRGQ